MAVQQPLELGSLKANVSSACTFDPAVAVGPLGHSVEFRNGMRTAHPDLFSLPSFERRDERRRETEREAIGGGGGEGSNIAQLAS